ncbi:GATOR complex protein MIOS-B isoform X3 [Galleria mellonella]|uniref:GATOR complex protein MIOS-B isoform X3 n=1 Tax=Galleria mellonella TaxID=7137 RepID=A0ABM3MQ71_GALME|nr:GATOR complex protein MIOS-B isoform X3 [Galleria mellonella]
MMSGTKLDVIWSPVHHNKFIIWGSDITLYEVSRLKDIDKKTTFSQISANRGATVVASQSASTVRCVDISAITEQPEPLVALGHNNGRVTLSTLKQTYDPLGLVGREFVPRYPRLCNSVSWSHVETNMLAVALEKYRNDHCILLWDVNRIPATQTDRVSEGQSSESPKPIAEMGLSETAHSVAWTNSSNRTLLASMNLKYIKIFDLRDLSNKAVSVATSRHCYGVVADPHNPWQLASRGEHVVCVWDARALSRPLLALPQPRPVLKMQWCPTRRNLLLSLQRDSSTLRLHDIQQANNDCKSTNIVDNEATAVEAELEEYSRGPSVIERDVTPLPGAAPAAAAAAGAAPAAQQLATFSWHPTHEARLLAVSLTGAAADYTVTERVTVAWGAGGAAGGRLVWSAAGAALRLMADDFYGALRDVSYDMRRRALTDYGLKPDLWQNADLAEDEALSGLWHFLALSKSLVEDGCIRNSPWKHPGVRTVFRGGGGAEYRSEMVPSLLPDLPARRVAVFRSAARGRGLQLCGWGWGWENAAAGVERAEAAGTPCRAAALAAFHLRLRAALDVLGRAREPQLRVVALALAGLSDERLWREALAAAAPALPDAYLRALLHFLAASAPASASASASAAAAAHHAAPPHHPDLAAVLNETEMRLEDRVAFACIFLSDAKLSEYLQQTCDALVEQGDLSGILLTGASPEGIALLQRWLENTGDVQSVALIAARCFTADMLRDHRVQHWLDSYRCLLDSWKLWWARCALDTWVSGALSAAGGAAGAAGVGGAGGAAAAAAGGACVACSYCGKAVAAAAAARPRQAFARLAPAAAKLKQLAACPHCRKPLPRCAVCALHLGGAAPAAFAGWFSWCVACRHGGHAAHLLHWFQEHSECPVSSCSCRCSTLDPPDRF